MQALLVGYANGRQLKELASDRFISYSTATQTVSEAKRRLQARNLAQAVVRAQGLGFISGPTGPNLLVFPTTPNR
jgi:DNA-binding NarL/FixJ family response regulator